MAPRTMMKELCTTDGLPETVVSISIVQMGPVCRFRATPCRDSSKTHRLPNGGLLLLKYTLEGGPVIILCGYQLSLVCSTVLLCSVNTVPSSGCIGNATHVSAAPLLE